MTHHDPLAALKAAVASDHHSRAAYLGQVQQTEKVTIYLDDGTPVEREVAFWISWDSISQILGLIRKRAKVKT